MAIASNRTKRPGLTRAIRALALIAAIVVAFVLGPTGHAEAGIAGLSSISVSADDGSSPEAGHEATCHGCLGHPGVVSSGTASRMAPAPTGTAFAALDDASPPAWAALPPVEPPRA
jgi:hypothetical protein